MGKFEFLKKTQKPVNQRSEILLAMPIFNNGESYNADNVIEHLKLHWHLTLTDNEGDNEAISFIINGETVILASVAARIPWDEIEGTAQYAYNWPRALDELKEHTGHAFVIIMPGQKSPRERFEILSKVLYSILKTSQAIGVYQGNQSLLIPKKQYIKDMDILSEKGIPVALWIYIGLREHKAGNSAYTYGLKDFHKQEIEIINSQLALEALYEFLFNISSYVICNDVTLKSGETVGYSTDQKIVVTSSKGRFVEGDSIKLTL